MNVNLFAVCVTALAIAFGWYARDYMVEVQKGEHVRNVLRLQQTIESYYRQPSTQEKL